MRTSKKPISTLLTLLTLIVISGAVFAAEPGLPYPPTSEASDQKAGSVLFYNIYTSSPSSHSDQNSRINITNTSASSAAYVHLFFVDGATCAVADSWLCLTANQTASFLASDVDPGITGFIVAIASDSILGCPVSFNFLIGDEYVKLSSGHQANLGAVAFAALYNGVLSGCDSNSVTATLNFNGVVGSGYNRAPRTVAVSSILSRVDGNDTLLIVNRFGGNLATGVASIGAIFGILYNDAEDPASFTFTAGCQLRNILSNSFPRTVPRFETLIPSGRTGWMKFWATSDVGLLGAVINYNDGDDRHDDAFNGGRNLHYLTLTDSASYIIPVFPPSC